MSKPVEVSDGNLDQMVLQSKTPVLVDFWAAWCGPCRMVAPLVEELAGEYDGKVTVVKLNVQTSLLKIPFFNRNVIWRILNVRDKTHR